MKKYSKTIKNSIKNRDIFSRPVKININRKGFAHTTLIGGIVSTILQLIYMIYLFYLMSKLFNFDDDEVFNYLYKNDEYKKTFINETEIINY